MKSPSCCQGDSGKEIAAAQGLELEVLGKLKKLAKSLCVEDRNRVQVERCRWGSKTVVWVSVKY